MRRENVGMSSKKTGENPVRRKPKVSWATQIVPGLVGPKARPKGVVDGQQVNIPALHNICNALTHFQGYRVFLVIHVCVPDVKSGLHAGKVFGWIQ